jgi:hypothetical protein
MHILLDENVPFQLKKALGAWQISTVAAEGWSGKRNGDLLKLADGRFDVLVTADKNIVTQQNLSKHRISISPPCRRTEGATSWDSRRHSGSCLVSSILA